MGGRGTQQALAWGIAAAAALVCSQPTKPCRHLPKGPMLHYSITNHTALSHLQISAHCTRLHKCRLTGSSNNIPHSISHNHHIILMSTKHSICSSWVRWYVLQWHASFLTCSGMCSVTLSKTIVIASNLTALGTCTHTPAILITTCQTTPPILPEAPTNTAASPVQLPTCQQSHFPYLPNLYSTTRLLPPPSMPQPDPQAPQPLKYDPTPTATAIAHTILLLYTPTPPHPRTKRNRIFPTRHRQR